jgi:hypothetical protein
MGKLILALVVTVWGAGIVLRGLLGDGVDGTGAYGAGQIAAFLFGGLMVVAGIRHIARHFAA